MAKRKSLREEGSLEGGGYRGFQTSRLMPSPEDTDGLLLDTSTPVHQNWHMVGVQ